MANSGLSIPRRALLAAAVSSICLAPAARADVAPYPLVDLQVVDRETGQVARVWRHAGRLYVAGRPGSRYSLRIRNNTSSRVLVVMSVDGINILTGETAGYDQKGYILRPYVSTDVTGWRKSDTQVAAFTFAPLPRSYAARTGRPHDVGVIGIAVFMERAHDPLLVAPEAPATHRPHGQESFEERAAAPAAPPPVAAAAPAARPEAAPAPQMSRRSDRLGTGHGAREWSVAATVPFQRATAYPQFVQQIEYDSHENLVAAGVIPRGRPATPSPRPFPSSPNGYVPDPPRWR